MISTFVIFNLNLQTPFVYNNNNNNKIIAIYFIECAFFDNQFKAFGSVGARSGTEKSSGALGSSVQAIGSSQGFPNFQPPKIPRSQALN